LWMGRIYIVKTALLSEVIYKFNEMPIKILITIFAEVEKKPLKIHKHERPK
jgi:hypothetical protein